MRRRILLLVTGVTLLVVLAFAVPIALVARSVTSQNAETSIKDLARNVATSLRTNYPTKSELTAYIARQSSESGRQIAVTTPDGQLVGSVPGGANGPGQNPPPHNDASSGSSSGSSDAPGGGQDGGGRGNAGGQVQLISAPGGEIAQTFAPGADGIYSVRVFLSNSERYSGATTWYLLLGLGGLVLLLAGIGAGEVLTRRITKPLVLTAETAQQLAAGDTAARAPARGPKEVADVGLALNRLADRIDELIAEERETVADLSHRLRTPLTTLRLDAEALRDPAEAERVSTHVSELERTLTAVIRAARRPQREGRMPSCDATAVVGARVEFWSALTEEQGRTAAVALPHQPLPVRAAAEDLAAAVDALLENVVAHTPEGTDFAVRLTASEGGATLEVSDSGPGIPEAAEVRGRSDRGSSGLGLSIARRCAEGSGGSMTIGSAPSGGALITLDLRAP